MSGAITGPGFLLQISDNTGTAGRTFADGVLSATSTSLTSATASFTASDVGRSITATGVPTGTRVASVSSSTSAVMTQASTVTGTVTGVTVTLGTGVGSFTTVSEVKDIKGPTSKTDVVDLTNQSSPEGFEEKAPTILRSGDVTFATHLLPSDTTQLGSVKSLKAYQRSKALTFFQITLPGVTQTFVFQAYVTGLDAAFPVAGPATLDVTLAITGVVSFG